MSLAAVCGWTLLRSLLVALIAIPVGWRMRQVLASLERGPRAILWTLLFLPFFTPALLTGYAWSNFSLSLIRYPGWNELLYSALAGLRALPVGVLLMSLAPPPPVSPEALHCARLAQPPGAGPWTRLRRLWPFLLRGPLRDVLPAAAVIFLLVFQEFELASLMGVTSWTVWLFDAQAGHLLLSETLRFALVPVVCEALVLAMLIAAVFRSQLSSDAALPRRRGVPGKRRWAWGLAITACLAVVGIPLLLVGRDTLGGLSQVLGHRRRIDEIATAAGFGLGSGTCAALLAAGLVRIAARGKRRAARRAAVLAGAMCSIPGLMGSLVVSLLVLWLIQRPPFIACRDTPLPAVLALVMWLLPRAFILQLLFEAAAPGQAIHLARLLREAPDRSQARAGGELLWRLERRRRALAVGILCLWGYLELAPVSILAPAGMTSAPVQLYNQMHYGRNLILSAMVLLTMAVPVAVFLGLAAVRHVAARIGRHGFRG